MEQDDEEFEKLLGEIPRATSAPPHLEELQRALGVQLHDGSFVNVKDEAMKPVTESRADEFYQGFYRPFPGARKSLESIEDGVFNDPPMLSPKSASVQLSSFYSGLALDDSRTSYQLRQLGLQQKQETQIHSPHSSQGQLQHSSSSGLADHLPKPQSEQQMLHDHDDQALSSAFAKLNFEESPIVEAGAQSRVDKGKSNGSLEHVMSTGLTNESDSVVSSGLYSHGNATSPGFGSASEESLESRLPRSLPSLDLFSQNVSSMRAPLGNGLPSGFDELPLATAGHVMEKRPLQRAPGVDLLSNGRCSLEPGEAGYLSTNHHPQQQQNNVAAYTHAVAAMAAAAMQSGCQYPNINGNELFPPSVGQQVQYPLDTDMASFVQAQRMQEAAIVRAQQQMEERVWYRQRMQQEFLLRQQQLQEQQARFYASLQGQPGAPGSTYSRVHPGTQTGHQPSLNSSLAFNLVPQQPLPKPTLTGSMTFDGGWKQQQSQGAWAAPMVVPEAGRPSHVGNVCRYFAQGFCCRGVTCPFLHFQPQGGNTNHAAVNTGGHASSHDPPFSEKMSPRKSPRNGQVVPPGVSIILSGSRKKDSLANGHSNGHLLSNGNHLSGLNQLDSVNGDSKASSGAASRRSLDLETLRSLNMQHHLPQQQQQQQQPKYTTLQEVEGRIYTIAKDQHGCRFLQRKFEEGAAEDVQNIFTEIIDHIVELMTDPFGNYLVQKLLEVCSETQRMEILCRVTGKGQLVTISLNMHGTRAVQKLIETLKSSEQVAMVISSLRQGVVSLIKDLNGNHVVQRCLQRLSNEDSQFIFDAAVAHCVEIATHRHGCCVLQRCVDFASGHQRQQLVTEIAANALVLSQDPFGNYVVQYILDLGISRATMEVITRLEGNYPHLAMQKFSSNVVEKCLKLAGEENKAQIIRELLSSSRLGQLLQDPYANYVVQSALTVSKGGLHTGLVEAIRPHLPALRSSPYGKRILSRTNLKK